MGIGVSRGDSGQRRFADEAQIGMPEMGFGAYPAMAGPSTQLMISPKRAAYLVLILALVVLILSGLAIWKPVQLSPLTNLLGGYVWARYWHFWAMLLLVALTIGHVFMVFTVDPYSLQSMITGKYREDLSPEARNARPFIHLLPQRRA